MAANRAKVARIFREKAGDLEHGSAEDLFFSKDKESVGVWFFARKAGSVYNW